MDPEEQRHMCLCVLYAMLPIAGIDFCASSHVKHAHIFHQNEPNPFWLVFGSRGVASLDGSTRDKEPLIIDPINGLGSQVLMSGNFEGAGIHTVGGVRYSPISPTAVSTSRFGTCGSLKISIRLTMKCHLAGSCQ